MVRGPDTSRRILCHKPAESESSWSHRKRPYFVSESSLKMNSLRSIEGFNFCQFIT